MHFNPYGGPAAQVAADLVNAGSASELFDAMAGNGMSIAALTGDEAARIGAWAARLRPVFAATPAERVDLVNALLTESACRPYITSHDGKPPHLHYSEEDAGLVGRVRAYTSGGLAHLVCEAPDRLGICGRDGCETAYVDTSRNGRRRFCSTRCATASTSPTTAPGSSRPSSARQARTIRKDVSYHAGAEPGLRVIGVAA